MSPFFCKTNPTHQRDVLNGQITLTKFALRASEVIFDSEVHFVSEVSPYGEVMGKLNFTASICEQLHCAQRNLTFASAKTSQAEKKR